ncbi:hypothetical protein SANTM175S_02782 [Streptomyces antimycoticus]
MDRWRADPWRASPWPTGRWCSAGGFGGGPCPGSRPSCCWARARSRAAPVRRRGRVRRAAAAEQRGDRGGVAPLDHGAGRRKARGLGGAARVLLVRSGRAVLRSARYRGRPGRSGRRPGGLVPAIRGGWTRATARRSPFPCSPAVWCRRSPRTVSGCGRSTPRPTTSAGAARCPVTTAGSTPRATPCCWPRRTAPITAVNGTTNKERWSHRLPGHARPAFFSYGDGRTAYAVTTADNGAHTLVTAVDNGAWRHALARLAQRQPGPGQGVAPAECCC